MGHPELVDVANRRILHPKRESWSGFGKDYPLEHCTRRVEGNNLCPSLSESSSKPAPHALLDTAAVPFIRGYGRRHGHFLVRFFPRSGIGLLRKISEE